MKQESSAPSWVLGAHFPRAIYYRSDPCIDASWFDLSWKSMGPSATKRFIKPEQADKGLAFIQSAPSLDVYYQQAPLPQLNVIDHEDSMEGPDFTFTSPLHASQVCDPHLKTKYTSDFVLMPRRDEQTDVLQKTADRSHGFLSTVSDSLPITRRSLSANNILKQQEGSHISAFKALLHGRTFSKRSSKGSPRRSPERSPNDSPNSSCENSPRYTNRPSTDYFNENSTASSNHLNQGAMRSAVRRDMSRALSWSDHLSNANGNAKAVLSAENWTIDLSQLFLGERFASGTYSRIYHGKYGDIHVAVKVIRQPDDDELLAERLDKSFTQEVTILSCLQHQNVIKFIAACKKTPVLCIITEYLSGGSIRSFLHKREGQRLPISQVLQMALDVAYGMEYLHMKGVVHRDLKSENLVLAEDNSVKILDFGVACFESDCNTCGDDLGTYRWMAPEMLSKKPYTRKVDVYSFGIVLWELVTGHLPYENMSAVQAAFSVVHKNTRPPIPPDCPALLRDLMCSCWSAEPEERPEFWEILRLLNMCTQSMPNSRETI